MEKFDFNSEKNDRTVYVGSTNFLTEEGKFYRNKSRWRYWLIALGLLCLVGLIIGLAVGLSKDSTNGEKAAQSENRQTTTTEVSSSTSTKTTTSPTTTESHTSTKQTTTESVKSSTPKATTPESQTTTTPRQTTTESVKSTTPKATTPRSQTTTTPRQTTTAYVNWLTEPCSDSETSPKCPWSKESNPLLLVSLDGFRAEYLLRNLTPTIEKLRTCGVHTPYMRSVYPTLTFPNHYSIVTGLYPESHGIVGNSMYDPNYNESFSMGGPEKFHPYWWGGEPMWTTTMKQGKKAASFFWVGSDMNISGNQPNIWFEYNGSITYEHRVDTVFKWLEMAEGERPDFMTLYFDEPDHTGHGHGPESVEVDEMLGRMDTVIRRLMDGLLRRNLEHCVNLVMIADHGMAPTSCQRQVVLDKYLTDVSDMLVYSGTTGYIHTHYRKHKRKTVLENEKVVSTEKVIDSLNCKNSHLNVFSHATTPIRHHYTNNDRIGDVLLDIEDSWLVNPGTSHSCLKGNHGYDNIYKSMQAMFLAHGPDIKQNIATKPFENIELYNFMADLLRLQPAPNNGTIGALHHLLRNPPPLHGESVTTTQVCQSSGTTAPNSCNCNLILENAPSASDVDVFPFGQPMIEKGPVGCILHGKQFSSIYQNSFKVPVLTSFTLTAEQATGYSPDSENCLVSDKRLGEDHMPDCTEYKNTNTDVVIVRMFDSGFSSNDDSESRLSSNKVPMMTGFRDGIWSYAWRLAKEYAVKYKTLHVTVGPIYDFNFDGLLDEELTNYTKYVYNDSTVPLPTHFYMVLAKCAQQNKALSECPEGSLEVMSFVLPHENHTNNCLTHKDFLKNNAVRIRDVEILTGLRFLSGLEFSLAAQLRTWLATSLWPTALATPWTELPCPVTNTTCPSGPLPLLLISLDGFRADYLSRHLTPTIQRLASCGVHTPYMRSVYPTVTFPNHYTIVTGLYPESHGIVSNNMYDEKIDAIFSLSAFTAKDPRWWKGEPIWITAMKQGLKTATYFWPGSDVNISGTYPDYYKTYDGKAGYSQRVYDVLDWMTLPAETRPDFITLYFDEPDHAGHNSGPQSEEVDGQLETVDELINILMSNLYEKGLHNCVNMIIVADHGMSPQSCDRKISLKDLYPDITDMLVFDRTFGQIFPQFVSDSRYNAHRLNVTYPRDEIVDSLMCESSAMKVFTKSTMPRRHHYMNSNRVGEVLLDMKDEWIVLRDSTTRCTGGNHGWDNTYKNMHALFLAHGPAFRENFTAEPFENIELYNLMTEVLNISGADNNGTRGSLHHMLRNGGTLPKETDPVVLESCNVKDDTVTSSKMCGCDKNLVLSNDDIYLTADDQLLLYGIPVVKSGDTLCMLYQNNVTVAYSNSYNSPQMLATIVKNDTTYDNDAYVDICLVNDTRITTEHCTLTATDDKIQLLPLFAKESKLAESAYLTSTVLPIYTGFYTGVWQYMNSLLRDYTNMHGDISMTSGPIYDYDNDGQWEGFINETRYFDTGNKTAIPTHIYTILIKCREKGDNLPCNGELDILSFILPNLQEIPNCLRPDVYLKDNVARIRDIELLTGLQFMTSYDVTKAARVRTHLPEDLWETTLPRLWTELECPNENSCQSDYKPILLISLGGFRADYLHRNRTPTLTRLSECGVHAPYMRPVFPTTTYPNHYSIVTGLYPESHGIIEDSMFDPEIGERFYSSREDSRWWSGEPIWTTAKKQGLKSASYMWPGSDVNGKRPDHWYHNNNNVSPIKQVIDWMELGPGERPHFISLYLEQLDITGKDKGPSKVAEIDQALASIDNTINDLMESLFQKDLHYCVNIIIVSDHGMADVSCRRLVRLKDDVDNDYLSSNFFVWEGSFGRVANEYKYNSTLKGIEAADNPEPYAGLFSNLTCANQQMNVYDKSDFPVRHHYANNPRINNMLLDVKSEYLVTRNWASSCWGGRSGFDNMYTSMEALFLATGPAFNINQQIEPFSNIELYNMFADILNLTSAPNNGTRGSLNHLLKSPKQLVENSTQKLNTSKLLYDVKDFISSVQAHECTTGCEPLTEDEINQIYLQLNKSTITSVPFGIPVLSSEMLSTENVTMITYPDYLIAFDADIKQPRWISYTLTEPLAENTLPTCVIVDPRLEHSTLQDTCIEDKQVVKVSLIENTKVRVLQKGVTMATSLVRMKKEFYNDILLPVTQVLRSTYSGNKDVNIVTGPVFDNNHDGLPDIENTTSKTLPSHFFVVLTTCKHVSVSVHNCDDFIINSYIIPHNENLKICKSTETLLDKHQARLRDIELITGFRMLTNFPFNTAMQYRTRLPVTNIVN